MHQRQGVDAHSVRHESCAQFYMQPSSICKMCGRSLQPECQRVQGKHGRRLVLRFGHRLCEGRDLDGLAEPSAGVNMSNLIHLICPNFKLRLIVIFRISNLDRWNVTAANSDSGDWASVRVCSVNVNQVVCGWNISSSTS